MQLALEENHPQCVHGASLQQSKLRQWCNLSSCQLTETTIQAAINTLSLPVALPTDDLDNQPSQQHSSALCPSHSPQTPDARNASSTAWSADDHVKHCCQRLLHHSWLCCTAYDRRRDLHSICDAATAVHWLTACPDHSTDHILGRTGCSTGCSHMQ